LRLNQKIQSGLLVDVLIAPSDSSEMFSVFLLISAIAVSSARWRKFAQTGKGASWMMFLSTFFTESSPSTFLSSSNEMRFFPIVTYFFAQLYSRSATLRPVKEIQKSVGSFKTKAALRHGKLPSDLCVFYQNPYRSPNSPGTAVTGRALNRYNAWAAIRKRAKAAGFLTPVGCHTRRATGITIYLENDGRLERPNRWPDMRLREQPNSTIGQTTRSHLARSIGSDCDGQLKGRPGISGSKQG
jgi:hypothetical protein